MEQAQPDPATESPTPGGSLLIQDAKYPASGSSLTATSQDTSLRATDDRFRNLVGETAWAKLPAQVQRRFEKDLRNGGAAIYAGEVVETRLSRAGKVLAWLGKAIGTPLPETDGAIGSAVVTVVNDKTLGGQVWTRVYGRAGRFPQVVHSVKRFCGATGLEEYVGSGISMSLQVTVEDGALVFRSSRYVIAVAGIRWTLPRLLSPGTMTIIHRQEPGDRFSFSLSLDHSVLGELVHQFAYFRDM